MNKYLLSPVKSVEILTKDNKHFITKIWWINLYYILYRIRLLEYYIKLFYYPFDNRYLVRSLVNGNDRYKIFRTNIYNIFRYYDVTNITTTFRKPIICIKIENDDGVIDVSHLKNIINKHDGKDLVKDFLGFKKIYCVHKMIIKFPTKETVISGEMINNVTIDDLYK